MSIRALYASLRDLWQNGLKHYFLQSAAAFLILVAIFFGLGMIFPELQEKFFSMTQRSLSGVVSEDGSIDMLFLLSNNISACGFIMLYGFLPFLRFPAFSLGVNAMVMGCTLVWYVQNGVSLGTYFAAILPHGIAEFPAMFLAFGMGLYICDNVTRRIRKDETAQRPWACMVWLARVHLLVLIPLLAAASALEVYVTPWVLQFFL